MRTIPKEITNCARMKININDNSSDEKENKFIRSSRANPRECKERGLLSCPAPQRGLHTFKKNCPSFWCWSKKILKYLSSLSLFSVAQIHSLRRLQAGLNALSVKTLQHLIKRARHRSWPIHHRLYTNDLCIK